MTLHCHPVLDCVRHTLLTTRAVSLQTLALLTKSHIHEFLSVTTTVMNTDHIGCIIKAVHFILVEVLWNCTSPVGVANSCPCWWTPTLVSLLHICPISIIAWNPGGIQAVLQSDCWVRLEFLLDLFFFFDLTGLSGSSPIYPPKCSHAILNFFYGLSGGDEFLSNIDFPQQKKNVAIKITVKPHFNVS